LWRHERSESIETITPSIVTSPPPIKRMPLIHGPPPIVLAAAMMIAIMLPVIVRPAAIVAITVRRTLSHRDRHGNECPNKRSAR
jgi:hypothetical protein